MQVFRAKTIYTMDDRSSKAEAIALHQKKIHAVGDLQQVLAAAGPNPEVIDLGERVITPGFIDAHLHLSFAAIYQVAIDCGGAVAPSIDALVEVLRRGSQMQAPGSWVVGFGHDELRLAERRSPTRDDLDKAFPDRPVFLMHFTCHEGVANSKALELAGIGKGTKDPLGGVIVRDRRGVPTGHLIETAMGPVEILASRDLLARDDTRFLERLRTFERMLFSFGVTRIADMVVPPSIEDLYRLLHQEKKLTMPIVMMPVGETGYLSPPLDRLNGSRTGEGDETLRVGPMKLFFDGANRCGLCFSVGQVFGVSVHFAKLFVQKRSFTVLKDMRKFSMRLGRDLHLHAGACYYPSAEEARAVADAVTQKGFGLAVHAVGNEAIAMAAKALRGLPTPPEQPFRIEHAAFLEKDTAKRIADTGTMLVMQPHFLSLFGDGSVPQVPGIGLIGLRTAIDAGCLVAGSSDAPVTTPDPLLALRTAVTRRVGDAPPFQPEEAATVEEVLQMYTRNAAHSIGCFDVTGSLEVGKRADFVVLSFDPVVYSKKLNELRVEKTFLGGTQVYSTPAE